MVAASGNSSLDMKETYKTDHILYLPGDIKSVIAVSAVSNNQITTYSNFDPNIQFCAPGGDLAYIDGYVDLNQMMYCPYPTSMDNGLSSIGVPQGYTFSCGTSPSTPAVTAGLADILSCCRKNNQE